MPPRSLPVEVPKRSSDAIAKVKGSGIFFPKRPSWHEGQSLRGQESFLRSDEPCVRRESTRHRLRRLRLDRPSDSDFTTPFDSASSPSPPIEARRRSRCCRTRIASSDPAHCQTVSKSVKRTREKAPKTRLRSDESDLYVTPDTASVKRLFGSERAPRVPLGAHLGRRSMQDCGRAVNSTSSDHHRTPLFRDRRDIDALPRSRRGTRRQVFGRDPPWVKENRPDKGS